MTITDSETGRPVSRLRRLHHSAFPIADSEATRQFMEDLLGIPLVATWSEQVGGLDLPEDAEPIPMPTEWLITKPGTTMTHTFYELADKSAVAFFQIDTPDFLIGHTNIFQHIALETDQAGQDAVHQRLLDAGVEHVIIDHGYVKSLYVLSPDGLQFEVCVDPEDVEEIAEKARVNARPDLDRWVAGDHSPNHDWEVRTGPQVFPGKALYKVTPRPVPGDQA
ncbi:VOC family protein [Gordonia amarae]|uniref:VOC domain-containing protein n=2 Tax=Gordonia amarae TaxID=36821 RepID=G7GLQ3_9ACTN|nr:VOC family protein [Gordonia amarae]MCS3876541.1 catechol 2,3-dioxygenase-like lactoylglutathione lyase family enzyme [Gordonia amarae]QHN19441.1 VOC family protein [Gordonia amarae]QHN23917.1 VOC family protein [Gordonia amarae]QHN32827.1 VOC family protein [Gordonia amarae]QHN41546.1 VOC family protein [Gordonia amarae]